MARILVVDDEESIQETFSFFLRKASHEVTAVGSVSEAFEALDRQPYELIITDILMPGDTGDVILDRVARKDEPPTVIMVTGQPDLEAMTGMMRRGAYDYLAKPVRKQTLLSTVGRALEHRQLTLSAERLARENERYREHLERLVEERTEALDTTNQRLMGEIEERMNAEAFMARQRDLALALSRAATQEEALVAILDAVQALEGVDASGIHLLQDTQEEAPFELFMTRGLPDNFPDYFHSISPGMPFYETLIAGAPLHTNEVSEEMDAIVRSPNPAMLQPFSTISMLPVRYGGKTVAMMNICSRDSIPPLSMRFLEAIAECLGGVIARVALKTVWDEQADREKAAALGFSFPPLRSWGIWEWDPASDKLFWSYSLCRLLVLPHRTRVTALETFFPHLPPKDAAAFEKLLRDAADGTSEPLTECTVQLIDTSGRVRSVLLICRAPLPERPRCMGMFISLDAEDVDAENASPQTSSVPSCTNYDERNES